MPAEMVMRPYSRTADAESVVLNFAKVLTYSSVLLYTLRAERKTGGREEGRKEGRKEGGDVSTACTKSG